MNIFNTRSYSDEELLSLTYNDIIDKYYKRRKVLLENNFTCSVCHNDKWLDKPIPLEIDHIDGNNSNWNNENIRALCMNCHAQTHTYRGRNKNNGRKIISDAELITCIKESKNIRQTLIKAGLTPKGMNYERVRTIMFSKNLSFIET